MQTSKSHSESNKETWGQWFFASVYWLLPHCNKSYAALKAVGEIWARQEPIPELTKLSSGQSTREEAELRSRELQEMARVLSAREIAFYNAQPSWSLISLTLNSADELEPCLLEFQRLVEHCSWEFDWRFASIYENTQWRKHGWKHISYSTLCDTLSWEKDDDLPLDRAELVGTAEEFLNVDRDAVQLDPGSIARLQVLFPEREDLVEIVEFYTYDSDLISKVWRIPTADEMAATLTESILRDPNSPDAEKKRKELQKLVSKGSGLGSRSSGGRPTLPTHPRLILLTYQMSYCLAQQIREVVRFLGRYHRERNVQPVLLRFYPWLKEVPGHDILSFLERSPNDAAVQISSQLLEMSPSKISKTIYERPH